MVPLLIHGNLFSYETATQKITLKDFKSPIVPMLFFKQHLTMLCVSVFVLCPLLHPFTGVRILAQNAKLTEVALQIGCPSYHLTPYGENKL